MSSYDQDYGEPVLAGRESGRRQLGQAEQLVPAGGRPLVIPAIENLRAYPPGRPWREVAAELGIAEQDFAMLAANENVLGPSPKALARAQRALSEAHLYPDGAASQLKRALSKHYDVPVDRLIIGNGSNDIIELLIRTFVGPEETVVTAWPSFVVYRLATQAAGRDALVAPLHRDRYDLAALAGLVDHRTKVVFIANPNNPTGTYVTRRELEEFFDRIPRSVIVVLDEAYIEYTRAKDFPNALTDLRRERLVVLRTFSKAYGLAGLRIGFGVMDPELIDYLDRVRQPYNVSSIAQEAAIAALEDHAHLEQSRALVRSGMEQLAAGLSALGLSWIESQANFLVVRFPGGAQDVQEQLKARGILVRAMSGYGMPDSVRVTVGTEAMNARVLAALAEVVGR